MTKLNHKLVDEIQLTLENSRHTGKVSQNQIDHVTIIVEAAEVGLPDLFRKVFLDLSSQHTYEIDAINLQKVDRLLGIVKSAKYTASISEETAAVDGSLLPVFTVTESEEARIMELCAAMRKIILATDKFDQPHRVRLLNRIAAIESETQKPVGLYDVVLGGISDLGETLGKFGVSIKPLTDRMSEVAGITRKGSKQYDQLPSPEEVKQLPAPDAEEQE